MNKILELRTRKGWSQDTLAEKLGMTGISRRNIINRWEVGKNLPSAKYLIKMADLFGVSIDEIMGVNHGN